jgi:hypothetical protein
VAYLKVKSASLKLIDDLDKAIELLFCFAADILVGTRKVCENSFKIEAGMRASGDDLLEGLVG